MIKSITTILFISLVLAGCSFKQKPAVGFLKFVDEAQRIANDAPCDLVHGASDAQSVVEYDFGCQGGVWNSVNLYLDDNKYKPDEVGSLRLLWKEKTPQYSIGANEKEVAEEFLRFIATTYLVDYKILKSTFMGTTPNNFSTKSLNFNYTYIPSKIYNLHRLEIKTSNSTTDE